MCENDCMTKLVENKNVWWYKLCQNLLAKDPLALDNIFFVITGRGIAFKIFNTTSENLCNLNRTSKPGLKYERGQIVLLFRGFSLSFVTTLILDKDRNKWYSLSQTLSVPLFPSNHHKPFYSPPLFLPLQDMYENVESKPHQAIRNERKQIA